LLGIGRFVEALDGDLVAEGIETEAELATLTELEIRYGQGYLIGRPLRTDDVRR
jgi:EAL domain-containing protein (putative c-di-GMP-specific phosphodiesterase class I)